jgi:hypothetical protein
MYLQIPYQQGTNLKNVNLSNFLPVQDRLYHFQQAQFLSHTKHKHLKSYED